MEDRGLQRREYSASSVLSAVSLGRPSEAGGEANGLGAPTSPSKLSDELARRLAVADSNPAQPQAALALSTPLSRTGSGLPPPHEFTFFCEVRHDEPLPAGGPDQQGPACVAGAQQSGGGAAAAATHASGALVGPTEGLVSKWRQKERLKTTAVALVMCLNIGVDPPDVIKISPCARLECWVDPLSMQAPKALDTIGKNLQAQYERWQPRAKYKMHLDPTTEDVKKLAISCRRTAKGERVLFHYNGHGVPRPTANGEVWVFNKSYTQYIPLSIYDLQTWVGTPAIYVFDCSAAGQILYSFRQFMFQRQQEMEGGYLQHQQAAAAAAGGILNSNFERPDPMRDCILLCACGESELLPQNPDLPADTFTSCLTTPIKVALRWFCSRSLLRHEGITKELIDRIPGKQTDRKTPLGELNWVFTAITDTIAWNVLPRALFQKLFRQDLLVASLFRNFLLAERIMRAANCNPVSYPRLPPTHQHPMWQAWDMAAEMCLLQLPDLLSGDGSREYQPSPFFSEQLTAFELWLEHGGPDKRPPEQLPIVLQVLLSQVHRLRALVLLGRFLDMGAWAVDLALSVGIFPYVLKLLQTTASDLRQTLVLIWAKIMAWDTNSQVQSDLVKDGGHLYFIKHLESRDPGVSPESRAQAAFVLAAICNQHAKGQLLCAQAGLLQVCTGQLPAALAALASAADADFSSPSLGAGNSASSMALLVRWLLLCAGKLCENAPEITAMALREQTHEMLAKLLGADNPDVRAAAVFTLGAFIQTTEGSGDGGAGSAGLAPSPASPSPSSSPGPGSMPAAGSEAPAAAPAAAPAEGPLPEGERLAVERAIACALLEVVYDASPLVRAEVAAALARVAVGHSLLFQDAVHAHQRTSARILREQQRQAQPTAPTAGGAVAASAPAAAGVPRSAPAAAGAIPAGSISRVGSSGSIAGGSAGSSDMLARRSRTDGQAGAAAPAAASLDQQQQQQQQPVGTAPAAGQERPVMGSSLDAAAGTSPGVRLREDLSYEPMLHVGLEHGGSLGGVYASADAARVGGGLYQALVEALCTLATDPSPKVAAAGLAALRAANVELILMPGGAAGVVSAAPSRAASVGPATASSAGMPVGAAAAGAAGSSAVGASAGGVSTLLPKSWQPKSWRTSSGVGGNGAAGGSSGSRQAGGLQSFGSSASGSLGSGVVSAAGSPNPSPGSATYTRVPFVLRRAPDAGDSVHSFSAAAAAGGFDAPHHPPSAQGSVASLDAASAFAGAVAAAGHRLAAALPPSGIYASSCRAFTWPLLAPQSQEEPGPAYATWLLPPDESKVELRRQWRYDTLLRTRTVGRSSKVRLRDHVTTVNTETDHTAAVLLEALRPFVVTADSDGMLRVSNYRSGGAINRFHAASGLPGGSGRGGGAAAGPPAGVRALYQLNELHNGLLMACCADGSVRVWRDYTLRGQQRLATAWQSVLVPSPGSATRPAVFHWSPGYSALFAAGGRSAERIYMWDLERENCIAQLNLPAGGGDGAAPAAEHMAASCHSPLLYAADSSGTVRIFDLRSSEVVGSVQHLRSRLAGMVAEPGGAPHHLVLGYPTAQLAFLDCRMVSSGQPAAAPAAGGAGEQRRLEVGVWKAVEAHSKGSMTALAAHPNAPLLATATNNQVVKVWSGSGEQVGVVRAHSSFLAAHRIGPVTCLAFAPYDLLLASGSADPVVAIYGLDVAPSLPASPARAALPSLGSTPATSVSLDGAMPAPA